MQVLVRHYFDPHNGPLPMAGAMWRTESMRMVKRFKRWWMSLALLVSILARSALSGEQGQGGPLVPPQATVVLMSSLPGDVESETAYREQMQAWLEIVADSAARRL